MKALARSWPLSDISSLRSDRGRSVTTTGLALSVHQGRECTATFAADRPQDVVVLYSELLKEELVLEDERA